MGGSRKVGVGGRGEERKEKVVEGIQELSLVAEGG